MIRTLDADLIKSILSDPELFSRIADDGITAPSEIQINLVDNIFLVNEKMTGIFIFHPFSSMCAWFHVNIQKHDRANSIPDAKDAINWAFDHDMEKLICSIPECFPRAVTFVEKLGFKLEGVITKSIKKNGNLYNQVIYGLEKQAWDSLGS